MYQRCKAKFMKIEEKAMETKILGMSKRSLNFKVIDNIQAVPIIQRRIK